jgi:hypothetical protein
VCLPAVVLVRSLRDACRRRLVSGVADILSSLGLGRVAGDIEVELL